uniref:Fibronectin type III domain-containing protein n=1 Tax=Candidatus Kentrum eta TaxID=2126337 RepID=A0A450UR17_9GAMM|nr:MAG: Fibronectin type III domain-containing protein [Candidatus Kentron sp. H]VFJ94910.1 MAG: Fibronectin type III domain-containing protein [Candidatus Kentron sp. H]VFK01801.1 MAG: Fibronectin type III domain-containing protein [Candidatus Kentron sp. H]
MATFPIEEGKIFILGEEMSAGLKAHPDLYPAPPVTPEDIDEALTAYAASRGAVIATRSAAEQATAAKQAALQTLANKVKMNLRYAEMAVGFEDAKLKAIGWGGRRERIPLAPPGQALNLVSVEQGDDWITLSWKKPRDGGKTASYEVRCRERTGDADYLTRATTTDTKITLPNQERGKELEYVVVAVNKAGKGPVSNGVMAVL